MKTARAEGNLERQKNAHALLFRRSICFSLRNDFKTDPMNRLYGKLTNLIFFVLPKGLHIIGVIETDERYGKPDIDAERSR
jgi:hypothetical protein